jgi:hypothetical protein
MYDKPQHDIVSSLDRHPIIQRVLVNPKIAPPRSFPLWGNPAYQFLAGLWTGAMITLIFTCKPIGRKEVSGLEGSGREFAAVRASAVAQALPAANCFKFADREAFILLCEFVSPSVGPSCRMWRMLGTGDRPGATGPSLLP